MTDLSKMSNLELLEEYKSPKMSIGKTWKKTLDSKLDVKVIRATKAEILKRMEFKSCKECKWCREYTTDICFNGSSILFDEAVNETTSCKLRQGKEKEK